MNVKRVFVIMAILLLSSEVCHGADIQEIIGFIVKHNTELSEMRKLDKSFFSDIKVEAYARAGMERQDLGLTASIPLFSPHEKRQRAMDASNKEREIANEASKLVGFYFSEMRLEHEEKLLQSLYNELQWIGKRVEAGIDNQKEYNTKLHAYIERRRDIEARKTNAEAVIESIISFVSGNFRFELRRMINEALSQDKKAEGQDIPLHQEGQKQ
jgi:hypothetical protein